MKFSYICRNRRLQCHDQWQNLFDQPLKNDLRTYGNIRKIATGQRDDYATGLLLNYIYFKEHHKMIAIDLSKQQALDANPKVIQQITFTGNLNQEAKIFSIIGELKEYFFDFSQGTLRIFLKYYFALI